MTLTIVLTQIIATAICQRYLLCRIIIMIRK